MSHPGAEARDHEGAELPLGREVIDVLVENHRAFLGFLERRVGRRDVAEDVLQEAFARSLRAPPASMSDESAVAWFYRVLRNAIIDHHRRGGASQRALAALASELEAQVEPDLDTRNAVCRCVTSLAGTLKPEYAAALRRVEVDGISLREYADEAGVTANNAGVRLFRAREALRKRVANACGTCAEHGCLDCTCGAPREGSAADAPGA
jgi:RNA polymerase sigma-70 factor (ECF subfamily)